MFGNKQNRKSDGEMFSETVWVTPDMAKRWLAGNKKNRRLSQAIVDQYVRDMANGEWELNPDGISFSPDGVLLNGQHRLNAVTIYGKPVQMYVTYNAPLKSRAVLDGGYKRTRAHRLNIAFGMDCTDKTVAITRLLCGDGKGGSGKRTLHELRNEIQKHREAIRFAEKVFGCQKRGITISSLLAAMAAAYYHVDHDRLRHFADVIVTGMCTEDGDRAAIALRDHLLSASANGAKDRDALMRACEQAISCFAAFSPRSFIRTPKTHTFPVNERRSA
jgi:hypothetical protein